MAIEKVNGFDAFMFDGETTELTAREQALMLNALRRTVQKWAELSTGENCSEQCKEYNQSQINAINQIGLWLKNLPATASSKQTNPEIEKQILF